MNYFKLETTDFDDSIPTGCRGVYKLVSLDESGHPIPVPRFLGTDPDGILYIGCSPQRTLRERIADLIKATHPRYKGGSHIFGRKYKRIAVVLDNRFPFNSLALSFEVAEDPLSTERKMIDEYRARFGEEPPFNSH